MKLSVALVLALVTTLPPLFGGQSGSVYLVQKQQLFLQTSASAPAAFPLYPFEMSFQAAAATNVVTGAGTVVIAPTSDNNTPGLHTSYATQAALDAAFPDGTFTFSGPPAYSVNLTGDLYPATTPAVLSGGTWTNGVLVIDPSVATTLTFSTFAGYASTGKLGHMSFQTNAEDGSNTGISQDLVSSALLGFPVSASPLTSLTLPAGTLTAGVVYQAELDFDTGTFVDTTSISGGALIGLYSKTLAFYIVGKPATAGTPISVNPLSNVTGVTGSVVTIPVSGTGLTGTQVIPTWFLNGAQLNFGNGGHYSIQNGSLVINGATASDVGKYFAIVVGPGGLAVTNEISLTLTAPVLPQITTQPSSVTVIGGTVVFNVTATGGGLSYQWKFNGANVPGNSRTSRLILGGVNSASAGSYTCVVSNGAGAVTSAAAILSTTTTTNPGRLTNLSVISADVTANQGLIVGFVVGSGSPSLPLLLRGAGPALSAFGLANCIPDPTVTLYNSASAMLTSNQGWASTPANQSAVATAEQVTLAFPYATTPVSLDSAMVQSLTPGLYSIGVQSASGKSGAALGEVYDDSTAFTAGNSHLINLSSRLAVGTGHALTAGFTISGSTAKTVLIRGVGPTLGAAPFNIPSVMPDPQLTLFNAGSTGPFASNTVWGGDGQIAAAAATVSAFTLPASSADSAILITLPPGGYTAQVSSASGAGGNALVEVYEVQ